MNSDVVRINQIKLGYSEATKSIIAKVVSVFDNGMKQERLVKKLNLISDMLNSFSRQEGLSVPELISKGLIIVDEVRLNNKEVVVQDEEKGYRKLVFDKNTGIFVDRRLTRAERKDLGLFGFEEDTAEPEVTYQTNIEEEPEVVHQANTEEESEVEIDEKNLVNEEKDDIVENSETENLEESDGAIDISGNVNEMDNVTREIKEEQKKKGIKFLKVAARAGAIIAAGYIIIKSGIFGFTDNFGKKDDRSSDNNNTRYEDNVENMEAETNYQVDEPNVIYIDNDAEAIKRNGNINEELSDENVEFMIQRVNDECFSFEPCMLNDLVSELDKMTVTAINDTRNNTLSNSYDIVDLLDNYVKYIFEGSTMFNDTVVKAYDYLTPFARYVVLVSGQSMLQLCHDYNYSTAYNIYDFDSVCDSLDTMIDQTYRELHVNNKTL